MNSSSYFPFPQTTVPEIQFPAIPSSQGAILLSILNQLDQTQWWTAEKILNFQFQQLNALIHHAYKTVPFYQQRLTQAGFYLNTKITPKNWQNIPLLTRDDIQTYQEQLYSQSLPNSHGKRTEFKTSGSTGKPIFGYKTDICHLFWQSFTIRDHLWHQRDFKKRLAVIRQAKKGTADYPNGISASNWGSPAHLIYDTGSVFLLTIQTTVPHQVEWLTRQDPHYLLTFASNAFALAKYCREQKINLPNLSQVRTISEVIDEKTRKMCQEAWNAEVKDMYSSEEVGYMALQCPEHHHYHLQSENAYIEILNEENQPCQPGEIGKVVVTPLHNFAMPLIRYINGDYAEVGKPCSCGRGLPVINRILGRGRNMLILPNGEARWPLIPHWEFAKIAPIKQYQIIQKTRTDLEFKLVVERDLTSEEETKIKESLLNSISFEDTPFNLIFSYSESIERSLSGKFEDFMSEVS